MKIIKQGLNKEEIDAIRNRTKRFLCNTCGCVFEADKDEYKASVDYQYTTYYCKCPNCNDNAFERMK